MSKRKELLHIYTDARLALFVTHIVEFVLLLLIAITVFTLPRSVDELTGLVESWDIFYRFIFQFVLGYAEENYISVGTYLTIFAFAHLVAALIVHGKYRQFLFVNILVSFPIFFFYPVGPLLMGWNMFLIYVYWDQQHKSQI